MKFLLLLLDNWNGNNYFNLGNNMDGRAKQEMVRGGLQNR
jgi:hypothetical protein